MPYYISPPPQNPLTRILAAIVAVFALVGFFMLGMVALLVIAGVALIGGLALWLRVAFIKRRLRKSGMDFSPASTKQQESGDVIDAEYTVISVQENQQDK